jgi:hypothetical protein
MTRNAQSDRAREGQLKTLVALAIVFGAVLIMAVAALHVLIERPGVPELVPGQQPPSPLRARIRL